jgi:hypothetical protein
MWGMDGYYNYDEEDYTYSTPKKCNHEWKATELILTIVYDCKLCGAKKEEVEDGKTTT